MTYTQKEIENFKREQMKKVATKILEKANEIYPKTEIYY
jgi:hypothetical protein